METCKYANCYTNISMEKRPYISFALADPGDARDAWILLGPILFIFMQFSE